MSNGRVVIVGSSYAGMGQARVERIFLTKAKLAFERIFLTTRKRGALVL